PAEPTFREMNDQIKIMIPIGSTHASRNVEKNPGRDPRNFTFFASNCSTSFGSSTRTVRNRKFFGTGGVAGCCAAASFVFATTGFSFSSFLANGAGTDSSFDGGVVDLIVPKISSSLI